MQTPQTSESVDPLPGKPTRLPGDIDWTQIPAHERDPYVVTDDADPFVWSSKFNKHPSTLAKSVMWFMYRMSGHLPVEDPSQEKHRDRMVLHDDHVAELSDNDKKLLNEYGVHLAHRSLEDKVLAETRPIPLQLPTAELPQVETGAQPPVRQKQTEKELLAMILEHYDILAAQDPTKRPLT